MGDREEKAGILNSNKMPALMFYLRNCVTKKTPKELLFSIIRRFFSGHERTVKIKKNIVALVFFKGISIVITFLLVPLTLNYLDPVKYGIWLTLSSIVGWVVLFDFGLGNGLRNKLTEALSIGDYDLAKSYVSTAYFLISFIIIGLLLIFFICNQFLNWSTILNAPSSLYNELNLLAIIIFSSFAIRFVSVIIETILIADQRPSIANIIEVIGSLFSLLFTYILAKTTKGSLVYLGLAIGLSTTIVPALASLSLFNRRYRLIAPTWKYIKNAHLKILLDLGLKFFILQIGALIIYSSANIIITQLFSPSDVVPYNIAFKYYSIASMTFAIILMPFWSAYTEAYSRKDIIWIQKSIHKLIRIWILLVAGVLLMTACANIFYRAWIGDKVNVPYLVSVFMGLYMIEITWCNIFVNIINGVGKIQLQIWASIIISISIIPLSIILVNIFKLGIVGVILAPCILLFPLCIIWPIQVKKILTNNAFGIWNR